MWLRDSAGESSEKGFLVYNTEKMMHNNGLSSCLALICHYDICNRAHGVALNTERENRPLGEAEPVACSERNSWQD